MLNKTEKSELVSLHNMIHHAGCFNSKDVIREQVLLAKATERQVRSVCLEFLEEIL